MNTANYGIMGANQMARYLLSADGDRIPLPVETGSPLRSFSMAAKLKPGERVRVKPWPSLSARIHGDVFTVVRRSREMPGWVEVAQDADGVTRHCTYLLRAQALERVG